MNPIPSLPTDNLYKFCAVAGGVAIIVAGLVSFQAWRDVLGQQRLVENRAAEQSDREWDFKLAEMASKPWWQPEGSDPEKAKKQFEEQAKRIKPVIEDARRKLDTDRERLQLARYDFGIVGVGTFIVAVFGFVLGSYGFHNWRILQLKQDQLLELELKQRRQETAKNA